MSKNGAFRRWYSVFPSLWPVSEGDSHGKTDLEGRTGKIVLVPKAGLEPARGYPTAPSRQRVYLFHHFGTLEHYTWIHGLPVSHYSC